MLINNNRNTFLSQWWWSIDRFSFISVIILIAFSTFIVAMASPPVAERIGLESFYFIRKHIIYIFAAITTICTLSIIPVDHIKKLSLLGFIIGIIMLIMVLFIGQEIKGAKRWINIFGFSMQPSEFMKPFFIVLSAWILSIKYTKKEFPSFIISFLIYLLLASLLLLEPDLGMTLVVTAIWAGQLFLAGISLFWAFMTSLVGLIVITIGYYFLPHVSKRIDNFLNPENTENYQVSRSIEAFMNGGLYGTGPGEGVVKQFIPDSHTDFIFAVIGEELGLLTCLLIISLYITIILRGFLKIFYENNKFLVFATAGILMQLGLQSIINMGVALNLLPTKGMTLPFISYGGSSMLSISISIGMLFSFTKRKFGSHLYHKIRSQSYKWKELR